MKLAIKSVLTLKSTSVFHFVVFFFIIYFHTFRSLNDVVVFDLGFQTGWVLNVTYLEEAILLTGSCLIQLAEK